MNKNSIKKFAIDARNKLIASVTDKAGMLGITPDNCSEAITKGADFEVYKTAAGTEVTLNKKQCEQRRKLVDQIHARGFEAVVEEVAYTWFNRICAIRFMEVNDYMYPVRVRVLSSEKEGKNEPDMVTMAPDIDWDFTDKEREEIIDAKMNNRLDDLFRMLFIKQCNLLHEVLPGLFEETEDYTEMLLNISFTNEDDVIRMLIDGIDEKDFNVNTLDEDGNPTGQVEIIGWLYQYYNTELKDDTFAKLKKNVKITKERIPAATQLFTPDWIVRYMVENSVGRIWIEHLRAVDPSIDEKVTADKFGWKYYLPEAEQEENVKIELAEIRKNYIDLTPEDITCIDPCMGSGHILVAMFDVLMNIYENAGYDRRDAAFKIVEKNIHGLDIDKRAYQLSYFAVMMKGRFFNRRFLKNKITPKVCVIVESNSIDLTHLKFFGKTLQNEYRKKAEMQIKDLVYAFQNAREIGSILNIEKYDWKLLYDFIDDLQINGQYSFEDIGSDETKKQLYRIVSVAELLGNTYHVEITNPPYMGSDNMPNKLDEYCRVYYPKSRYDLYATFLEHLIDKVKINGYVSMICQHSWMYLQSFKELRREILSYDIVNMAHLGARAFEEIAGEVVQTTTFVIRRSNICEYLAVYCRLNAIMVAEDKRKAFLNKENVFFSSKKRFFDIPNFNWGYWISEQMLNAFKTCNTIGDIAQPRQGLASGNNSEFYRYWHEINIEKAIFNAKNKEEVWEEKKKYVPVNKGGGYKKWYGNNFEVIKFDKKNYELLLKSGNHLPSRDKYFLKGVSWGKIASSGFSARYYDNGFVFTDSGMKIVGDETQLKYICAFLHSKVAPEFLKVFSETIHYETGNLSQLPIIFDINKIDYVMKRVNDNISIAKEEWDSYEYSWDFKRHPLVRKKGLIRDNFAIWEKLCKDRFDKTKSNEQELNSLFINDYGLVDEIDVDIKESEITLSLANENTDVRSLVSYAVGCMFGRYSFDDEGIAYAGGKWNDSRYKTFLPDYDNCIPITDEEYFSDDIVARFIEFIKIVYGADTLEENLDFIAKALGNKGDTSREIIRNYFLRDFYADHLKIYQKRPIYWLFDSGKQNGFKALIYMHRYDADTVGRVRTDYLHKAQKYVETAMQSAQYTVDNATSASEKSKATKAITKYTKQLAEMKIYDEAIAHVANQRIEIDLDDGVKVNYAKFQGVEVAQEGKKALKVDLLAKI